MHPAMPPQAPPTAVLDTNVLLDWLLFADPPALALGEAVRTGALAWLSCPALLAEFRHVLGRPLPAKWEKKREQLLTYEIESWSALAPDPPRGPLACRDPDDQKFIDLALQCRAHWLISRDKALLCLARKAAPLDLRVATPAQWLAAQRP